MKTNSYKIILGAALLLGTSALSAQTLNGAYFMERMPARHTLNPAFVAKSGYISLPVIGGMKIGINSNMGVSTFLFPEGDKLLTGLHPNISSEKFLGKLSDINSLEFGLNMNILSFGFRAWGGSNSFEISLKSQTGVYLPKDLFAFIKNGNSETGTTQYDLSNLSVSTNNYVEIALGHAHRINDRWTVGAKLKGLVGVARAKLNIEKMTLTMSEDEWKIKQSGYLEIQAPVEAIRLKPNNDGSSDIDFNDNIAFDSFNIPGYGGAVDLGVTYKPIKNLTLSAAVTDIGFLQWKTLRAETDPSKEFSFKGFENLGGDNFDQELENMGDDLEEMIKLYDKGTSNRNIWLAPTMRIGAEYAILRNKISFGLLSSTYFDTPKTWTEAMLSVNFRPVSWFHATIDGSLSTLGHSAGLILHFCPKGFNFFIGSDYVANTFGKQGIPVNSVRFNVNFGVNFTFGFEKQKKNV